MKFLSVKVSGNRRATIEVHPAADAFPLVEGPEFDALVADIKANGFRHPVVLEATRDVLVDGRNRMRAGKKLGIDPPITRLGAKVDAVAYIISTNVHRRHLTESQRAYIAATLATLTHGANQHTTRGRTGKFAGPANTTPTQAAAAKLMGVSERSVRDARRVIDGGDDTTIAALKDGRIKVKAAADLAQLSKAQQRTIVAKVTAGGGEVRSGKVSALAKQEGKRATVERINSGQVRPLAIGPFALIVADYPWPYTNSDNHEGSRGHIDYPPMELADIIRHARTDIAKVAADDAILGLWVTNAFVPFAHDIVHAAGFTWRTMITWDKLRAGVGSWPRGQTEHLVIASKGAPVHTLNELTTYHAEERREHSRKPDRLMGLLAKHCPGPHLELFARESRPGWVSWGAEAGKFAGPDAPEPAAEQAPSLTDACPKCGRELGEHWGTKCPDADGAEPAAAADPVKLLPTEWWTCHARPMNLVGGVCNHVNMVVTLDTGVEVCGKCRAVRPGCGWPARPEPEAAAAEVKPDLTLELGDMILVRWQPGTTKQARFARYTNKGDMVVNVQAVDAKGGYLNRFGSDRTFKLADYAGRAPL